MYRKHYQLKLKPFEIGPDPKFLWLGEKHKEAFAVLKYGILENKGFIVLIGEPGTGKSTLLNAIAETLGSNVRFAKISDPALNELEFFNFAASAFEMGRTFNGKAEFLIHLETFINEAAARSQKVLLVIDEAQRLTPELLEQIRLFSNFEAPDKKVISCIFAGQNEFLEMLKPNRALSQRIFFSHILRPLTEAETEAYIAHRLTVAGAEKPIFTLSAMRAVYELAGGNPRLTNIVCDQALLSGYSYNLQTIGPDIIRECTENTLIPREASVGPAAEDKVGVPPAGVESREDAADALPEEGLGAAVPAPGGGNRKASYWALAAVFVLMGLGLGYFSGGFNALLSNSRPSVDKENVRLQAQMVEITNQKSAAEARLGEAQKQNTGLAADAKELKSARDRVAQLEAAVSEGDKKRIELEQKFGELEKALAKEKGAKDQMSVELSSRQAAAADLQKQLETARSAQLKLETDIQNTQRENARLQSQLQEAKAQKPAPPPAPAPARAPADSQPPPVPTDRAGAEPDPGGAIDFVIKKKSQ